MVTGLAVVVHIGILGLSLPYVFNLMRASESQSANFVPVELIEREPTDALKERELKETEANETEVVAPAATTSKQRISVTTERATTPESTTQSTAAISNNVLTTPNEANVSAVPESDIEPEKAETPLDSELEIEPAVQPDSEPKAESETNADSADSSTADADLEPEPEQTDNGQTDNEQTNESGNESGEAEASESGAESSVEANTSSGSDVAETIEPPVVPGEQELPVPGEVEAAVNSSQVAYIRVVGHSYVPEALRRDIADTLPEPVNYPDVQLDAEAIGCGRVEFPVGQVAYRVVVGPTGVVRQALPWTGGIEGVQMSEGERAITCLIESASFSFTPAMSEGTPVANSDLILTLDVIESSGG